VTDEHDDVVEEVDLLGALELALRAVDERIATVRGLLAPIVDQHDAIRDLRSRALELAVEGDGRRVVFADLVDRAGGDTVEEARLESLLDRVLATDLPVPR
jgi:hypothetical protein